jgi:hypothetical protein
MAMKIRVAALSEYFLIFLGRPIRIKKSVCSIKMFLTRYLYLHVIKVNRIGIKRFRLNFFIRLRGSEVRKGRRVYANRRFPKVYFGAIQVREIVYNKMLIYTFSGI